MNLSKVVSIACLTLLAACGGGTDTTGGSTGGGGTGGGSTGGGGTGGGSSVPPQLVSPLSLTSSDLSGMWPWHRLTLTDFETLNASPPITVYPGPRAVYEGEMLARKGAGEEFMGGYFLVDMDFSNGTGLGFIESMDISGNDTSNRLLETFNVLDVRITDIDGATFVGTVNGTVSEQSTSSVVVPGTLNPDAYTVNAALEGRIVDDQLVGGVVTGIAATLDGTVTSARAGTETLKGVAAAQLGANSPFQ